MRFESAVKIETLPRNWVENNYTNDVKKVFSNKIEIKLPNFQGRHTTRHITFTLRVSKWENCHNIQRRW